jgi:hypothetical protein
MSTTTFTIPAPRRELGNAPFDNLVVDDDDASPVSPPQQQQQQQQRDVHPPLVLPKKRLALALLLLLLGLSLLLAAAASREALLPAGLLGALCVLPGAYMCWGLLQAYRGNPRYAREVWFAVEEND